MKEQLLNLAEEMVKDIKDLKDLTKQELPELAKEYIKFNLTYAKVMSIISFFLLILTVIICTIGYINVHKFDDKAGFVLLGSVFSALCLIAIFINITNYLKFKCQPRRSAIEAITSLLKD